MQFLGFRVIFKRIKAIRFMMKDRSVPKRKKALIIAGIIYLFLPVDLIPPILFPIAWVDDLILWIWILWHLREELDTAPENGRVNQRRGKKQPERLLHAGGILCAVVVAQNRLRALC